MSRKLARCVQCPLGSTLAVVTLLSSVVVTAYRPGAGAAPTVKAGNSMKALVLPARDLGSTWQILTRDGANRKTPPYLSSLGHGETGIGTVSSPPFVIAADTITFTLRGHDGQGGGRGENYVALVDARKGQTLLKTMPPNDDALREYQWDVHQYRGSEVRIEVHDGNRGSAFAWLGIGRIDAGPAVRVDFRNGLPAAWRRPAQSTDQTQRVLPGGVPFRIDTSVFGAIPPSGSVEIPCGFAASRLFFLGGTVTRAHPLDWCGAIEIHYQSGTVDIVPLVYGYTLDGRYKRPGDQPSLHLLPSADPYQRYLAVAPRPEPIDHIRLVANPEKYPVPRISAITCQTNSSSEHLIELPATPLSPAQQSAIKSKTIVANQVDPTDISKQVRSAYGLKPDGPPTPIRFSKIVIDPDFRSEGIAIADFDGDGRRDIGAGTVYYTAPGWRIHAMTGTARSYPQKAYSDAFLCFADDVNADGATDMIMVGFPGRQTSWLENPGSSAQPWQTHVAIERTGNESPAYVDVTGDKNRELVFMDGGTCAVARPGADPRQLWKIEHIGRSGDPAPGHGLGIGDINGDQRPDIVCPEGWWEAPADRGTLPWRFRSASLFGGAQLCVSDLDDDGDADVLGTSAHGYGIAWTEQTRSGWTVHPIDDRISQTHAVCLADINGDGLTDFVTGKRFWAHNGHDPGSYEPAVLCWFEKQMHRGKPVWIRHTIDQNSGVGLHFAVTDLNRDGLLDIVTSNKHGVCLFQQTK